MILTAETSSAVRCLRVFSLYLKTINHKLETEKPVSQEDDGDDTEKVEELTEDKSGKINVIPATASAEII